jgi:hypothetical protein
VAATVIYALLPHPYFSLTERHPIGLSLESPVAERRMNRRDDRMLATVYQVLAMLTIPVATLSIGANLGLLHLLWMLVGSRLRARRGALLPGLNDLGLPKSAYK